MIYNWYGKFLLSEIGRQKLFGIATSYR